MMKKYITVLAVICSFIFSAQIFAHGYSIGALVIQHPWSKEIPADSQVTSVYFSVFNYGEQDDVLIFASSPIAKTVEFHRANQHSNTMKMHRLPDIKLIANSNTQFKHSGDHLMLFGVNSDVSSGESFPLTLMFKKAGQITVNVKVETLAVVI